MFEPLPSTASPEFTALMQRGSQLHQEGELPHALIAFEEALKLAPGNLDASSAVAAMLSLLGRPLAAYKILQQVETGLMNTADGAANLAIAAESCGDFPNAHKAYEWALQLDPDNLRALTNVGLIASGLGQWDLAIACARKRAALDPVNLSHWQALADVLTGARRYPQAQQALKEAQTIFPGYLDITVRRITVLAFSGDFDQASAIETSLDAAGKVHLREFLVHALRGTSPSFVQLTSGTTPFSARELFCTQAFVATAECDWRHNDTLTRLMREALSSDSGAASFALPQDSPAYGLTLDLNEAEVVGVQALSLAAARKQNETISPAFTASLYPTSLHKDDRIHIGFAIQQLRQIPALKELPSACNATRFAFHIYSFAQPSPPYHCNVFESLGIQIVEMAHMSDAEAVSRIRLDALDVYIDTAEDAYRYRPQVVDARVARVQLRQHSWLPSSPCGPWDYTLSDRFVHPQPECSDPALYAPIVRLPVSCWLTTHAEPSQGRVTSRESAGLPPDAWVLCSGATPLSLDEFSFSQWMTILRSLPDAILWLPAISAAAANHLAREAAAQGVAGERLLFSALMPATDKALALEHVDLVMDTLRQSHAQGVIDALRLGVPAITCAGNSMASRMGASILQAAGLPELITHDAQEYISKIVHLGRNPQALATLRHSVSASQKPHANAAFFNTASRVQELEAAWTWMAERSRAGLQPEAFDVPSCIANDPS